MDIVQIIGWVLFAAAVVLVIVGFVLGRLTAPRR